MNYLEYRWNKSIYDKYKVVISQNFSVCLTRPKLYKVTKSWCNMVPPSKMFQNFMYDHTTDAIAYHSYPRQPLTDGGRCRHCRRRRPPTSSTPARRQMDSKWNSTKKIQEENVQFHATHIVHYISLLEVDMPWLCHFFEPSLAWGNVAAQPPSKIVLSSLLRKAAIS